MKVTAVDALDRWSWLVAEINGRAIVGQPKVRDPEYPCDDFAPGTPNGDCATDGHYLCGGCVNAHP